MSSSLLPGHRAQWWAREWDAVRCQLCPRHCFLKEGQQGFCGVRFNAGGEMRTKTYGYPVALQIDPIEKKPLNHFLPGTKIFSIGTFGCTLGCVFCQNDHLSMHTYKEGMEFRYFSPEEVVLLAKQYQCESVAFTYNEPTVFAEYAVDVAEVAHRAGLKTVFVTNGFIDPGAARSIYPHIDAMNVDMKGFAEEFYQSMCSGKLQPVLDAILYFHNELGRHLELTNLIIPGKNDAREWIDRYLDWVEANLGCEVPLHFTPYFPAYKYHSSPRTSPELLYKIRNHAKERGFLYIH